MQDISKKIHPNVTVDLVERCVSNCENLGICLACGEEADGCEPDARGYKCDCCGEHRVYGAEEALFML